MARSCSGDALGRAFRTKAAGGSDCGAVPRFRALALHGLGASAVVCAGVASAATVVAIEDADTLRVRAGGALITIRLACVEAPELGQQPHGARARAALLQLVPVGSAITLVPSLKAGATTAVAEVYNGAGNVNLAMVQAGQAFTRLANQPQCDPLRYPTAEHTAQFRRLGVWDVPGGRQRPWEWRAVKAEEDAQRKQRLARSASEGPPGWTMSRPITGAPLRRPPSPTSGKPLSLKQQCIAVTRREFLRQSQGLPVPHSYLDDACSCLTRPGKGKEELMEKANRCVEEAFARHFSR